MTTFINKYWNGNNRRRDYEATNVCFAVAEIDGASPRDSHFWEKTEESVPSDMDMVYAEGGVWYYGYL